MASQCNLSTKDLTVIEDQLTHLATACRVAQGYSAQFQDAQLRGLASTVAQHHRQQFDALFAFLNGCQ
ncbi:MAG: hypothetical protein IJ157_05290 [Clostridia bacterium]|nr:hypothetical protein [Clostridia bacterium]